MAFKPKRVCVAVSGGVDSLCALILLKRSGREVAAIHGRFLPESAVKSAVPLLAEICESLHIPLHVFNFEESFREEVIKPFARSYATGLTPNPCAHCNRLLKFGLLQDKALELGADLLATGHYADLTANPYSQWPTGLVGKPLDQRKDQSYFLALVDRERLDRLCFPLARLQKAQCRAIVAEAGLKPPTPHESQDICFVPGGDYGEFLKKENFAAPSPGPVYLLDAENGRSRIGSHQGLWRHTVGQRRGLNIPHREALYVLGKDLRENALLVGPKNRLAMRWCAVSDVNFFAEPRDWPVWLGARARASQKETPARVELAGSEMRITFLEPQFPSAPGQIAAVYDREGRLLAGGVIRGIGIF